MLDSMAPPHHKSLKANENEAIREYVRQLLEREFEGNQSRAAVALGLSQGYISDVVAGRTGGGVKLLRALARHANTSIDALLGHEPEEPPHQTPETDPYPARAELCRSPVYSLEPELVRQKFEAIRFEAGHLLDRYDWQKLLTKIRESHDAWLARGEPGEFTVRPSSAGDDVPRTTKAPKKRDR
jgi:transcriptional regulator with XRE-family HTH domain